LIKLFIYGIFFIQNTKYELKFIMKTCSICNKKPQSAYNRPNSLHKTKKVVYPNLQKKSGKIICAQCLKTLSK